MPTLLALKWALGEAIFQDLNYLPNQHGHTYKVSLSVLM